ncbi:MAG: Maf family protein [Chthoniobacterales bacterium]
MDQRQLILASRSPRRQQLLEEAGVSTVIAPADIDELSDHPESPRHLALENAYRKALVLSSRHPEAVVLAADTIVVLNGEIFGKPETMEVAQSMLSRLAGQTHEVITGVCLSRPATGTVVQFEEVTRVHFRKLSPAEIEDYLQTIDPLDKAGGYSAQEDGRRLIERIEGSLTNVIGLPMERTLAAIQHHFPEITSHSAMHP